MKVVGIDWIRYAVQSIETPHAVRRRNRPRDRIFEEGIFSEATTREWSLARENGRDLEVTFLDFPSPAEEGERVWRVCVEVLRPGFDLSEPERLWDTINNNLSLTGAVWRCVRGVLVDPRYPGCIVEMYASGTNKRPDVIVTGYQITLGRTPQAWEHVYYEPTPEQDADRGLGRADEGQGVPEKQRGDQGDLPDDGDTPSLPDNSRGESSFEPGGAQGDVPSGIPDEAVWELPEFEVDD